MYFIYSAILFRKRKILKNSNEGKDSTSLSKLAVVGEKSEGSKYILLKIMLKFYLKLC